jgi:two-component system CheB/CheR fusion protein
MQNPQTILIVEDEPDGQELVARMLSQVNVPVDVAGTAEDALDLLEVNKYGAVVIDLALPGMDGFQLLGRIRADNDLMNLTCIAMTAFHTPELKRQAIQDGFDAYFAKPLDRTRFLGALDEIIKGQ